MTRRIALIVTLLLLTFAGSSQEFPLDYPNDQIIRASQPVGNEYLIVLKPGAARDDEALARAAGGQVLGSWSNAIDAFLFRGAEKAAQALLQNPNVLMVEENGWGRISAYQNPAPWDLDIIDGTKSGIGEAEGNYSYCNTGAGVRVYVVDTGVRASHQEFWRSASDHTSRVLQGFQPFPAGQASDPKNGTANNPCSSYIQAGDGILPYRWGHGTAVASVVGGLYSGVSKAVQIVPVRVAQCDGQFTTAWVLAGIDWIYGEEVAQEGEVDIPSVANFSIFLTSNDFSHSSIDVVIQNLVNGTYPADPSKGSFSPGVTVVASANNQYKDVAPQSPTACNPSFTPARVPDVITVAGSTSSDTMWIESATACDLALHGSNYGPRVDIFAPAVAVTSAHVWENGNYSDQAFRSLHRDGTSFAAPIVAGLAAQALEPSPWRTPSQVWSILQYWAAPVVTGQPSGTTNLRVHKACRFRPLG